MNIIQFSDFQKIDMRAGTIIEVHDFPEARKPAYKLIIDFGELGIKKSSAQITHHYTKEQLIGKQIVGVVNLAPRQIGPFISEVLVTGFANEKGNVILVQPNQQIPNGSKLF